MVRIYNQDCLVAMKQMKDKYFDLAIVDPPYGIGRAVINGDKKVYRKKWEGNDWDTKIPEPLYFDELKRCSKHQIIWGGNYFPLPPTSCWVIWDKMQNFSGADFEMAWTSFDKPCKAFRMSRADAYINNGEKKIHPTQKPSALYKWILENYAIGGDCKILDTHLGSGSSAIAAYDMGYDFTGYEIDADYFAAAQDRLNHHMQQGRLFE